ncbi:lipoprotein [uncultured Ruegeria sp.]|uniref:lipoprotein n=1 Tax=uncultured Ruegeria sp. TaxID=259304 RepID=UPI00261BB865|nr:lipoprotein [uncultured Ruegeria sp.]
MGVLDDSGLLLSTPCRYASATLSKMLTAMKKILLPALAVLTLSACEDPFNREGVGFTGIDGEPRTVSDVKGAVAFVPSATNIPAELAKLPTVQVSSDKTELEKIAGVAIDNGGRTDANAVQLEGSDTNMYLSTVSVNGKLFGVLRTENNSTKVDNSIGSTFGNQTERFTGCLAAGDVYRKGSSARSAGFAVPLNCR